MPCRGSIRQNSQAVMVSASAERSQTVPSNLFQATCCYQPVEWRLPAPMKQLLLVHNLVHGQSVVHELDDKDFAVELVEGDPDVDEQGEMDVDSRFFIRVDNE